MSVFDGVRRVHTGFINSTDVAYCTINKPRKPEELWEGYRLLFDVLPIEFWPRYTASQISYHTRNLCFKYRLDIRAFIKLFATKIVGDVYDINPDKVKAYCNEHNLDSDIVARLSDRSKQSSSRRS